MPTKHFQHVETLEVVSVEEGGDASFAEEVAEDTTNKLWREVSASQAGVEPEVPAEAPAEVPAEEVPAE